MILWNKKYFFFSFYFSFARDVSMQLWNLEFLIC